HKQTKEEEILAKKREKEAFFLSSAAFCYSQMGNFTLAIQYAKETLDLSTKIGNKERMAKAHSTLGNTYTFMGAYSQALEEHLESLRI
ncbi:tetratricopeptide repeat protein, partial [bacterium]|nr:tetratricopeptide repeat protein [bacterium]